MQCFGICIRFAKKDQTVASRFKTNPGSLNQVSIIPLLVFFYYCLSTAPGGIHIILSLILDAQLYCSLR
jgi:hypothetical protein